MKTRLIPVDWEKVYIFISSTFGDMHAERDYLVKRVFPQLSEWAEKRKLHIVDIDLRWGVTETDVTHNKNVVNVCLNRIDDCRPFFICFLGQRYGWIPEPKDISEESFIKFPGLEKVVNERASLTELEVLHALISPFHSQETVENKKYYPSKHSFFYLRDKSYLYALKLKPKYLRRIYSDEEESDNQERKKLVIKQKELIKKIEGTNRPCRIYQAQWSETEKTPEIGLPLKCPSTIKENQDRWRKEWLMKANVRVTGLDVEENPIEAQKAREFNQVLTSGRLKDFTCEGIEMGEVILRELKSAIAAHFPEHMEIKEEDDLQKDLEQQEQFVFVNSEGFIKRPGDFDELDEYVNSDSRKLFFLTGEAGMGKSTLLSNWVNHYRNGLNNIPGHSIHFRFIGKSDYSTTVTNLLYSLLREIKELAGKIPETEPKQIRFLKRTQQVPIEITPDTEKIREIWSDKLPVIGSRGKTLIVLDALDQLENGLSDLGWLPKKLPNGIKLIVSFKRDDKDAEILLKNLRGNKRRYQISVVRPFDEEEDQKKLIKNYLSQYLKELDSKHIKEIINLPASRNPLFLKILLSELRIFGVFERLGEKIKSDFGSTPLEAFESVLNRLESDPCYSPIEPKRAVPLIFGLISHSRNGLTGKELAEMLIQAIKNDEKETILKEASDTVYLFLSQVRSFLTKRDGKFDFFYENFMNAVLKKYTVKRDDFPKLSSKSWHQILANYFYHTPLWDREKTKKVWKDYQKFPNRQKTFELAYQLISSEGWDRLNEILCDLKFIGAKCAAGMIYDLIKDYKLALNRLPEAQKYNQKERDQKKRVEKYIHDLISYAKGTIKKLDIISSVIPCYEEEIEKDLKKTLETSSPLDRLRAFYHFVVTQSYALERFKSYSSSFCIQQAYNLAVTGPVVEAAEEIINEIDKLILLELPSKRLEYNPNPALVKTIYGHTDAITAISITPDGKRAVSGGWNDIFAVWDLESGKCIHELEGHKGHVYGVCIVPDGKLAISGSTDTHVRVWDLDRGICLRILKGHKALVKSVDATPDGSLVVSGSGDDTIRVWELKGSKCLWSLEGHTDGINSVCVTPDGRRLISASDDNTLRLWDLGNGKCLKILKDHKDEVSSVSITPDGRRAISASHDETVKLWDLKNGECILSIENLKGPVSNVSITPDGKRAVFVISQTIWLWDLDREEFQTDYIHYHKLYKIFKGHTDWIPSIKVTADGRRAVSAGSWDSTIRIWDLERGRFMKHEMSGANVSLTPDKQKVTVGSYNKSFFILSLDDGDIKKEFNVNTEGVKNVRITPDEKRAIYTGFKDDGNLWILDLKKRQHETPIKDSRSLINCLSITPDGELAVTDGYEDSLQVWDLRKRQCLQEFRGHKNQIMSMCITPDSRVVVSASNENTLFAWDIESGECLRILSGHIDGVQSVNVTPDGRYAISGGNYSDPTIRKWDLRNGQCVGTFNGHSHLIHGIGVSPDGKYVVSGSEDLTVRLWNLETHECLAVYFARDIIYSVTDLRIDGRFACKVGNNIIILTPVNLRIEYPIVTPIRMWLSDKGNWGNIMRVTCPWCGQRFRAENQILNVIHGINWRNNIGPDDSPCLKMPDEAWDDPKLLSECPNCQRPLQFNPFIVDNKGRY